MALTLMVDSGGFHFSGRSMQITKEKNALLKPYGKMLNQYGIVLELLPDESQIRTFQQTVGCARVVHNHYIDCHKQLYREEGRTLSVSIFKKEYLPVLKEEKPYLREVDKFALEAACEHADDGYKRFFSKKAGYPNYVSRRKPSGNRYTTKYTNGNIALSETAEAAYLKIPRAGQVRFILPKKKHLEDLLPENARITKVTVSCKNDRWFASVQVESIISLTEMQDTISSGSVLAGDAGIKEFLIYGSEEEADSIHVKNPRWIKTHERKLRRAQRKLSRRQYDRETHTGSKNWEKARKLVAKEQMKTANQRKDFQHKLSRQIADSCKVFIIENLNIKGMMKNRYLSKAIASVGWYGFFTKLKYKLEKKGGIVIKADRYYASSQLCCCCGIKNPVTKDLKIRSWICPACGAIHDRDENAKSNLWKEGVRLLKEQGYAVI